MTDDLSQCTNCIYYYTYNGKAMCKQVGDDFYLQWKVEDCPYHTTITSATRISDEIYQLRAENAALRKRFLPCKVGDYVYDIANGTAYKTRVLEWRIFDNGHIACRTISSFPSLEEFGTRIFLKKEAAEARLAELKGENNG